MGANDKAAAAFHPGTTPLATPVIVSPFLPIEHVPTFADDMVRVVRHAMRRTVEYIGEDVGPLPGEVTHTRAMQVGRVLVVSADLARELGVGA